MELRQTRFEMDHRGIARATFDRPKVHNVLNPIFMDDLHRVMDRVEADGARALVLTGAGPSFCAGGDLRWMREQVGQSRAERVRSSAVLARFLRRLDELPLLTLARVNGPAYGGGLGIIAACDVALAHPSATFALTEVTLGLVPSNIAPYVVRRVGPGPARRLFLTARRMDASEAARVGLVSAVTDDLDRAVEEELHALLRGGPQAVAAAKRLVDWVDRHGPDDNAWYTARDLADAWEREEGREGIAAFLEKREPEWRR